MRKILIIDDEKNICASLTFALEDNYTVYSFLNPVKALELLKSEDIDLVLLDLRIGEYDGITILQKIKHIKKDTVVIIMTAYGTIKSSVNAIKAGAYYYITKPIDLEELKLLLQNALEYKELHNQVEKLNNQLVEKFGINGIVGNSKSINKTFEMIDKIKNIDSNVLITGESGTGKELFAKAIHYEGKRRNENFEAINCAAIPSNLLESELFGYEKGAFSGAVKSKKGKFTLANNGTIFLDEIGEMDPSMQSKLLRVIQDKVVTPLGSTQKIEVNMRIIAATNRNLEEMIKDGTFREDLFYRLNVITLNLPNLKERKEDIPLLVDCFIKKYNSNFGKNIIGIDEDALELLENYEYKGNIRELENIIERAVALTDTNKLSFSDFPKKLFAKNEIEPEGKYMKIELGTNLKDIEKKIIIESLKLNQNDKHKTANDLGITERTLRNKLNEYNKQGKIF